MPRRIALVALVALIAMSASIHSAKSANLPSPKRPLVFVPGIIGSELWVRNARVWGGLSDITHLDKLEIAGGPRDVEPLQTCSESDLNDNLKRQTCGPIEGFSTLPPFSVDQYASLFNFLENMGYKRSGPGRNLFVFAYDWRRSNFQTADDFRHFVDSEPGLAGKQFDILAHSMGGLVALIYTNKYDAPPIDVPCSPGICRVQSVITLGTPFWGSVSTISTVDMGWGDSLNWIAGGRNTIRKTILSWPSFYELLPAYDGCCVKRNSDSDAPSKLDIFQFKQWQALPFLDNLSLPEDKVTAALNRRADLRSLAEKGFPSYIKSNPGPCDPSGDRSYAIVGNYFDTDGGFVLSNGRLRYIAYRGDDTVLVRSASRSDPSRAFISFTRHRKLFSDEHVLSSVRTILLRCDLRKNDFGAESLSIEVLRTVDARPVSVPVYSVAVDAKPPVVVAGEIGHIAVRLELETTDDVVPPSGILTVVINDKVIQREDLTGGKRAKVEDGTRIAFEYSSSDIKLPEEEGVAVISAKFPDIGTIQSNALILAKPR